MLTVKEVWEKTGIPEEKLYYQIKTGKIKTVTKYGRILISDAEANRLHALEIEKRKGTRNGNIDTQ